MSAESSDKLKEAEMGFIDWATENVVPILSLHPAEDNTDLEALAKLIGNRSFVALSEGFHNCSEIMSLHYRIIRSDRQ